MYPSASTPKLQLALTTTSCEPVQSISNFSVNLSTPSIHHILSPLIHTGLTRLIPTPPRYKSISESGSQLFQIRQIHTINEPQPKASIFSSVVNLTNAMIGSGILTLSYAASQTGVVLSCSLLIIVGILTVLSLYFLMHCGLFYPQSEHSSFMLLSRYLPKNVQWSMDVSLIINCFGTQTGYLVVIGDLLPSALSAFIPTHFPLRDWILSRNVWIIAATVGCIAPVVRLRTFSVLKWTSVIALLCFLFIAAVMVSYAIIPDFRDELCDSNGAISCQGTIELFPKSDIASWVNVLSVLPIFVTAFVCHHTSLMITNELGQKSLPRLNIVNFLSVSFAVAFYIIVGLCGYYTFGSNVESDVLLNYPSFVSISFVRIALAFAIVFSYPTLTLPCRDSLASLLWRKSSNDLTLRQFYLVTYIPVLLTLSVALSISNLGLVLSISGATGGIMTSYILPGFFYYYMNADKPYDWMRIVALTLSWFGITLVPICLTAIFMPFLGGI